VPPPGIETIDVDLSSEEGVRAGLLEFRECHGAEVASVLHFAAYYDLSGDPSPRYEEINVRGSERLISGLREAGLRAEQFVYASTMVVHAPGTPGHPIVEDAPTGPTMDYSRSKLRAEETLRALRGDTRLVILRLANVYDDRGHHPVLAQQVRRLFERRLTARFYPGDPGRGQSYLHLEDLLDAVERVVARRGGLPDESTLLLGEPGAVPYGDIQRALGRLLHGSDWTTHRVPKPLARAGAWASRFWPAGADPFIRPWMIDRADDHYALDVSRARDLLGWAPKHALLDTLPAIAESLRADPEGWYRENKLD
jgi:nucleoside-diphosphate-sugar epimerase